MKPNLLVGERGTTEHKLVAYVPCIQLSRNILAFKKKKVKKRKTSFSLPPRFFFFFERGEPR